MNEAVEDITVTLNDAASEVGMVGGMVESIAEAMAKVSVCLTGAFGEISVRHFFSLDTKLVVGPLNSNWPFFSKIEEKPQYSFLVFSFSTPRCTDYCE